MACQRQRGTGLSVMDVRNIIRLPPQQTQLRVPYVLVQQWVNAGWGEPVVSAVVRVPVMRWASLGAHALEEYARGIE